MTLADPRHLFTAENIVPLIYKPDANATVVGTLDAISAKLTAADLLAMNKQVMVDRDAIVSVAGAWLTQTHLG